MSVALRIVLLIASLLFLALVAHNVRHGRLDTGMSLVWMLFGLLGIVVALFPQLAILASNALGFERPVNFVFFGCIFMLVVATLSLYVVCTRQERTIRMLVQELSILKAERDGKTSQEVAPKDGADERSDS